MTTHYNGCVELENDYEVIFLHETAVSAAGHVYKAPVSSETATWTHSNDWGVVENHEIALDPMGEWFESKLAGEVYESRVFEQAERVQLKYPQKRSKVSVHLLSLIYICCSK